MDVDNEYRWFRYFEDLTEENFADRTNGWLLAAEQLEPKSPKAILLEMSEVELPNGSKFRDVSFKREHDSLMRAMAGWASTLGQRFGWIEHGNFHISDGQRYPVSDLKFTRAEPIRRTRRKRPNP